MLIPKSDHADSEIRPCRFRNQTVRFRNQTVHFRNQYRPCVSGIRPCVSKSDRVFRNQTVCFRNQTVCFRNQASHVAPASSAERSSSARVATLEQVDDGGALEDVEELRVKVGERRPALPQPAGACRVAHHLGRQLAVHERQLHAGLRERALVEDGEERRREARLRLQLGEERLVGLFELGRILDPEDPLPLGEEAEVGDDDGAGPDEHINRVQEGLVRGWLALLRCPEGNCTSLIRNFNWQVTAWNTKSRVTARGMQPAGMCAFVAVDMALSGFNIMLDTPRFGRGTR